MDIDIGRNKSEHLEQKSNQENAGKTWVSELGKICLIVPHQDDELLMAAGLLKIAASTGKHPYIVMVTNGDCDADSNDHAVGELRLRETLAGVKLLGVPDEYVTFLGYADTGMPYKDSFLAGLYDEKDPNAVHPSHCSNETYGLPEKPDFHTSRTGFPAQYTRAAFTDDLKSIINEIRPDSIITTALCDTHGDHAALYKFVVDELKTHILRHQEVPALYVGLVHSPEGDKTWPLRNEPGESLKNFTCPQNLEDTGGLRWEDRISLQVPKPMQTPILSQNLKYQAISCHKYALKPDAVDFLYAFVKADEIFWKTES